MSAEDRESRDRAIEETIARATRPESDQGGVKPPEEESLHDVVQRRMRERAQEAAREHGTHDPSSGCDREGEPGRE